MQENNQPFVIDVDTIYGIRLQFRNDVEIAEFLSHERAAWGWLEKPFTQTGHTTNIKNTIAAGFSLIERNIQALHAGNPRPIIAAIREAFDKQRIPLSTSPIASFVSDAVEASPEQAALYLAAWMNPGWLNFSDYEHVNAAFMTAAFGANLHPRTGDSVAKSLKGAHGTIRRRQGAGGD